MNSGWLACHYDLVQLGYPHEDAELQQTEPFWCQFDQVRPTFLPQHEYPAFGYTQFNYIYEPFNVDIMQDFTPVFIGSNTANGKVLRNGEGNGRPRHRGNNGPKQLERVSVMIDDTLIGDARLGDFKRFSKTIGAKFAQQQSGQNAAAGATELGFTVDVGQSEEGHRTLKLMNDHSSCWHSPPSWAFAEMLYWMSQMSGYKRADWLPPFEVEDLERYRLHEMVDVYAAALVLDIRPKPVMNDWCGHIIQTLAYVPPTVADFRYLHEHLPLGDFVLKKMVEKFFVHGDRGHYNKRASRGQVALITEYVNTCGDRGFKDLVCDMQDRSERTKDEPAAETENGGQRAAAAGQDKGKGRRKGKGKRNVPVGEAARPTKTSQSAQRPTPAKAAAGEGQGAAGSAAP